MTGSLARYHSRSPRYILDTYDNNLIRLSGAEKLSWEEKTVIRNISLTGLSFTAPRDLSPQLGEIIKIQFQVPGSETMACYALIIRIEVLNEFDNEIAIHFYKLDRIQRINLVQGLAEKMTSDQAAAAKSNGAAESRKNSDSIYRPPLSVFQKTFMVLTMITCLLAWITLLKVFWS
jgi:hypothetical protein